MTMIFNTLDPVYVQLVSGFLLSVLSILVINFFVVKKKLLVPAFFTGFKSFNAKMPASDDVVNRDVM